MSRQVKIWRLFRLYDTCNTELDVTSWHVYVSHTCLITCGVIDNQSVTKDDLPGWMRNT